MTVVVNPIPDVVVREAENRIVNLISNFDDPFTTGLVARFELFDPSLGGGVTNVLLFDQPGAGAPLTVQNFRTYVTDGDYTNSFIHRSVPGFVVQGGGFTINGFNAGNPDPIQNVLPDPPVPNEFSRDRSNVRGTIAMAKLGNNPNSATSQWFFNLSNTNANNLDNQNGGFTVFGQVLSAADLAPVDAIAALPQGFGLSSPFNEIPLKGVTPANFNVANLRDDNFVRYRSITVSQFDELQFAVVNNSNPNLLTASISNKQLLLTSVPNQTGIAEVTIRATNLLGRSVEDTFVVTVAAGTPPSSPDTNLPTAGPDNLQGTDGNDVINALGGNDQISGLGGNDRLVGQDGQDTLNGDAGRDFLQGGAGNDVLNGGAGNDRIEGGPGRDRITTGSGRDTILIGLRDGLDTVTDFSDRRDKIQLLGRLSFDQLTIRQRRNNTLISAGRTNLLVLEDVNANVLTQADFI